ncbi:hypothetical protein NV379_02235 [Paenibacillus sp. N1-5-1-14]|uniref:hypothetical protein n=1 Tax=Paenibacillus radicibacter TaxID=2972488 RepID=UPI002159118D|nr:hypothetical protein [Paenibacillus radicibacter]MCR8641465.1 hypothetical protein [Paenibacillus radicibacter]
MKHYRLEILKRIIESNIHIIDLKNGEIFSKRTGLKLGSFDNHGYLTCTLTLENKNYRFRIHEIIAIAGSLVVAESSHIIHTNGIISDNRLENLQVVEKGGGAKHAYKMGKVIVPVLCGEHAPTAKLTLKKIEIIKKEWSNGSSMRSLGVKYGVSHTTIRSIVREESWSRGNYRNK